MEAQSSPNKYIDKFLSPKQKESYSYFTEKFDELYSNPLYRHKFAVISGETLLGIFDTYQNAIRDAVGKYKTGDYIIQELIRDDERVNFLSPAIGF
ncbi:MAG: hypothetical protein FWF67_03705 [Fibromonadales bacterium]|nr:hypothetical protein [Fibromonadales bacterium]